MPPWKPARKPWWERAHPAQLLSQQSRNGAWMADYLKFSGDRNAWAVVESRRDSDSNLAGIIAFA